MPTYRRPYFDVSEAGVACEIAFDVRSQRMEENTAGKYKLAA
jgi:hypothetical protein